MSVSQTKPPSSTSADCWRNTNRLLPSSPSSTTNLGGRGLSLRQGTIVDAALINAPSSTKNKDGRGDPEMHQIKKGNLYYFGMKAQIDADDESCLVCLAFFCTSAVSLSVFYEFLKIQ